MQPGALWKLNTPTIGIHQRLVEAFHEGGRTTVVLPANAIIKVIKVPEDGPFIEVEWDQKRYSVFRVDLRDRGQKLSPM